MVFMVEVAAVRQHGHGCKPLKITLGMKVHGAEELARSLECCREALITGTFCAKFATY